MLHETVETYVYNVEVDKALPGCTQPPKVRAHLVHQESNMVHQESNLDSSRRPSPLGLIKKAKPKYIYDRWK
ncbi:unnamed protein product [Cochlearia groenlandica]